MVDPAAHFKPNQQVSFQVLEKSIGQTMGSNLATVRRWQGMRSKDAALKLGLHPSTYHSYETGQAMLPNHVVARWSAVMGIPPHFLLKNTRYSSNIPLEERGKLIEKIQPFIGLQTEMEFEVFVRDICLFTKQPLPDFQEVELRSRMLDQNFPNTVSEEVNDDLYGYVAENLRSMRQKIQLSQQKMSELLQISDHIYRRIENLSKPTKFQFILSPRWWMATGIHPVHLIEHSHYSDLRRYQSARLAILNRVLTSVNLQAYPEIVQYAKAMSALRQSLESIG
ncbi:helix-turn-helix transcriptional regulator [Hahella ganghwensis]|uniref:helix-turn-helix transcriptional regulator n=1 Tax=Hahella ganghwensis TaxID=286420 RepID=UPI0003662065|nr:helix-turn-helix transcriptional regulator [Hahella ganghwensis]